MMGTKWIFLHESPQLVRNNECCIGDLIVTDNISIILNRQQQLSMNETISSFAQISQTNCPRVEIKLV